VLAWRLHRTQGTPIMETPMKAALAFAILALAAAGCGRQCKADPTAMAASAFCIPDGGAPAGQALTLRLREQCGGCGRSAQQCDVERSGSILTLALKGETCDMTGQACDMMCRVSVFDCSLPALEAGSYEVKVAGLPSQTMVVATGGTSSCALPAF
jgi:hypothetical protein